MKLFSKTVLALLISFTVLAAIPAGIVRAQCSGCADISIVSTVGTDLDCPCTTDACNGAQCLHQLFWTISLSSSATCCIDSITINTTGVCWEGCVGLANNPLPPILWGDGLDHASCNTRTGEYFGNTSSFLCPAGASLEIALCTNAMSMSGTSITLYWSDGTFCPMTLP
jgi:hypothetical protein